MILIAICFLTFGSYWVYDTPGAIQTPLTYYFAESGMTYTNSDNSLLYSVYSWPNVILAFFGGYIIDRFLGVRLGSLLFCSLVLLGQVIFSMGIQFSVYYVCVLGRFVYGLGGESLTVSQSTFTARWFDGKLLALAFGKFKISLPFIFMKFINIALNNSDCFV
jgi:MFS family permease